MIKAYLFMGLNVHSDLLRMIRDGGGWGWGWGDGYLCPSIYTVTTRMTLHYGGQLCETF